MSFLRFQNIKKDGKGRVVTGSASIMKTVYDNTRTHKSHQEVVEKLGKVLWVADDGRSRIFFKLESWICMVDSSKKIVIDYPTKGVKKLQKEIKLTTDNNIKYKFPKIPYYTQPKQSVV